jgi:hypothetical protein
MRKQQKKSNGAMNFLEQIVSRIVEKILPKNNFVVFAPGELTKIWEDIEKMEPKMAIIEADKLVDVILKKAGITGNTMAERLRRVQKLVQRPIYSDMWEAHKLRNHIVHEVGDRTSTDNYMEYLWRIKKFMVSLGAFKND